MEAVSIRCDYRFSLFGYANVTANLIRRIGMSMKVLFLNAGNETGGGMVHILQTLYALKEAGDGEFVLAVLEEGEMKKRAEALGIHTVCFDQTRFPFLHALQSYIKEEQFTHIHTHGPRANVWMAFLKKRLRHLHCEWVATVHSNPLLDFVDRGIYGRLLSNLHIRALRQTDKVITVCGELQGLLKDAGVTLPVMTTIRNGVVFSDDTEGKADKEKQLDLGFLEEHIVFVQIARLEAVKAHASALSAFKRVLGRYPFARLVIVGSGPLEAELKKMTERLGIDHAVLFLGERHDVAEILRLAHITLLTSISEGFPYVLLEAAQAKRPIIATDVGDIRYLLHEKSVGWLVELGNEIGIVQAMEEAITAKKQGILKDKGEALYDYAKENFSLERSMEALYGVYRAE